MPVESNADVLVVMRGKVAIYVIIYVFHRAAFVPKNVGLHPHGNCLLTNSVFAPNTVSTLMRIMKCAATAARLEPIMAGESKGPYQEQPPLIRHFPDPQVPYT